ncbi:hypothetical protein ACCS53_39400, partial [Rhizobium ruizarguesonis]
IRYKPSPSRPTGARLVPSLMFCPKHTREYNKGYNFASNLSDPVTARYKKEAASGSSKTWGNRVDHVTEMPLPSTVSS